MYGRLNVKLTSLSSFELLESRVLFYWFVTFANVQQAFDVIYHDMFFYTFLFRTETIPRDFEVSSRTLERRG